jgi:hypothetical protein
MGRFSERHTPTSTSRSARINRGEIVRLIWAKRPVPKRSIKTGSLLTSKRAENRHSDFVRKCVRISVELGAALAPAFDA